KNEYVVANAAAAVSADKMNVMYVGVDNPITVSAAGIAPTDLQVSISGCGATLTNNGNGKYVAKAATTGTCIVTVMAKTATGMRQQGPPQVFRVKAFPNPPFKVGGKSTYGNMEMTASAAKLISGIGVDNAGFDFVASFKITEFTMTTVSSRGVSQDYKCYGSALSAEAKQELSRLKPGNKIFFENIRVEMPNKTIKSDFPIVKITVK
ncbi:MAG: gliding motility-associated protein GldM, partial [Bacteroidetes bacterium]|nr:gliding motility-associated protein GldM [Bacteroidota bacterium]